VLYPVCPNCGYRTIVSSLFAWDRSCLVFAENCAGLLSAVLRTSVPTLAKYWLRMHERWGAEGCQGKRTHSPDCRGALSAVVVSGVVSIQGGFCHGIAPPVPGVFPRWAGGVRFSGDAVWTLGWIALLGPFPLGPLPWPGPWDFFPERGRRSDQVAHVWGPSHRHTHEEEEERSPPAALCDCGVGLATGFSRVGLG